jgi:hypothetical protein
VDAVRHAEDAFHTDTPTEFFHTSLMAPELGFLWRWRNLSPSYPQAFRQAVTSWGELSTGLSTGVFADWFGAL